MNKQPFFEVTNEMIYNKVNLIDEKITAIELHLAQINGYVIANAEKIKTTRKMLYGITGGMFTALLFVFGILLSN